MKIFRLSALALTIGALSGPVVAGGSNFGIALDKARNVRWCRMGDDNPGRLDPNTGLISELATRSRSMPRRMDVAPEGMLWAAYYGNGRLGKVE